MAGLGRVNLLVGTNNCGKTSVLEAISILVTPGSAMQVWSALARRGETHEDPDEREVDLAHLFYGHALEQNASFNIQGENAATAQSVHARLKERDPGVPLRVRRAARSQRELFPAGPEDEIRSLGPLMLDLSWQLDGRTRDLQWPISRRGGLSFDFLPPDARRVPNDLPPVQFITTEGLQMERVVALYEEIVLTELEETVLTALRTIEPKIERIAPVKTQRAFYYVGGRGGVAVRVAGQRIPIGSMGDGIWRLLGIAVALVQARGGVLLVDEIDTGLHYSVLADMWKLVYETARRLDVQVFATTHSRDCYEALAAIAKSSGHDVSLQRIERGNGNAIAFTEAEIREAAARGIEVR